MLYRLGIMAALAGWAAPLRAQVGLTSPPARVALSATKAASVGVSLPDALSAANSFVPVSVITRWNLEPERTGTVTLVARNERPGRKGARHSAGGSKRFTSVAGTMVVFAQRVSSATAAGRRTDELRVPMVPAGTLDLLVITQ